jgi:putative hemolysin
MRPSDEPLVTEEEINVMMEQGRQAGVFAEAEQDMVQRVFRLGDRNVTALITRRSDINWLDLDDPWEKNRARLPSSVYSRLPVCRGGFDEVVGVVRAKDLLDGALEGQELDLAGLLQTPVFVPETLPALRLLESFKVSRTHLGPSVKFGFCETQLQEGR